MVLIMSKMSKHNFYCMYCGKTGIPLARKQSFKHERFHRKKLYCPWCKTEVNHIECKDQEDISNFIINFQEGVYEEEANKSISFIEEECKCGKLYT